MFHHPQLELLIFLKRCSPPMSWHAGLSKVFVIHTTKKRSSSLDFLKKNTLRLKLALVGPMVGSFLALVGSFLGGRFCTNKLDSAKKLVFSKEIRMSQRRFHRSERNFNDVDGAC